MLQRKGPSRGLTGAGLTGARVILPALWGLLWKLWWRRPPRGVAGSVPDRTESLRAQPSQLASQNKHFLPGSPVVAKGLGLHNPPVFPGASRRWAGLGTSSSGRRPWGERGCGGAQPPEELCGQRTEDVEKCEPGWGVLPCLSKQEARPAQPWRRKINSGDLFLESGKTLFLSKQWNLNLKLASLPK